MFGFINNSPVINFDVLGLVFQWGPDGTSQEMQNVIKAEIEQQESRGLLSGTFATIWNHMKNSTDTFIVVRADPNSVNLHGGKTADGRYYFQYRPTSDCGQIAHEAYHAIQGQASDQKLEAVGGGAEINTADPLNFGVDIPLYGEGKYIWMKLPRQPHGFMLVSSRRSSIPSAEGPSVRVENRVRYELSVANGEEMEHVRTVYAPPTGPSFVILLPFGIGDKWIDVTKKWTNSGNATTTVRFPNGETLVTPSDSAVHLKLFMRWKEAENSDVGVDSNVPVGLTFEDGVWKNL